VDALKFAYLLIKIELLIAITAGSLFWLTAKIVKVGIANTNTLISVGAHA
jgi:hypothetical protein